MFDFFDTIIKFLETIWGVVTSLIEGLITFFGVITQTSNLIPTLLSMQLPSFLLVSITATVAISLAKLIAGR